MLLAAILFAAPGAAEPGPRGVFITAGPTFPRESGKLHDDPGWSVGFGFELSAESYLRSSLQIDVHTLTEKDQATPSAPVGEKSWQGFDLLLGLRMFPTTSRVRPYADVAFGLFPTGGTAETLPIGARYGIGVEWRTGWRNGGPTLSLDGSFLQSGETLELIRLGVGIP